MVIFCKDDCSLPAAARRRQTASSARRHQENQQRIQRLKPSHRNRLPGGRTIDTGIGPQGHGIADLLVDAAEYGDGKYDGPEQQERRAIAAGGARRHDRSGLPARDRLGQVLAAEHVNHQSREHADTRGAKTPMPAIELAERAADQRRQKPADVDADIVDVVGAPAAGILGADKANRSDWAGSAEIVRCRVRWSRGPT